MSKIPALMGGRALEHDAPFEAGYGLSVRTSGANTQVFKFDSSKRLVGGDLDAFWEDCPSSAHPQYHQMVHELFDDFNDLSTGTEIGWNVTEDTSDCTQVISDAINGVALLTNKASTDDNGQQIQWHSELFKLIEGKKLWFECKIMCSAGDATNLDFFVGLSATEDLTGVADSMPANGVGFHKDDGDTNIDVSSSDGGTNLQVAAASTLVDATFIRLGFKFDGGATGSATITPYINGTAGTAISSVTYATMAEMSPIFMVRNGDGSTAQNLNIDYIKIVAER